MTVTLYQGDCLDILPTLTGTFDAIITDLPYGTTQCDWDAVIPFKPMWEQVRRLLKSGGAFVTTAGQPFTSALVMSNPTWFKYCWVWDKVMVSNFLNAKREPLVQHDDIAVFAANGHTYNPQLGTAGKPFSKSKPGITNSDAYGQHGDNKKHGVGYPKTILRYPRPNNLTGGGLHPTQKPVALYEYLVRTYTNPGDVVLDFCMGSGTTCVACLNTGRSFVGIEKEPGIFADAQERIREVQATPLLPGILDEPEPELVQAELVTA